MTDHAEKLLVTLEDGIKRITFNKPERRNSVDHEMIRLLRDAIAAIGGGWHARSDSDGRGRFLLCGR